jgi:hypothetical protein
MSVDTQVDALPFSILFTASSNSFIAIRTSKSSIQSCSHRIEFALLVLAVSKPPRVSRLNVALTRLRNASFPFTRPSAAVPRINGCIATSISLKNNKNHTFRSRGIRLFSFIVEIYTCPFESLQKRSTL